MKLFQVFHEELLSKEPVVGNLKGKAQDLLEHKEHVPGLKDVKKQLRQLEKRWTSLKEISDDRRKSLETLVDDLKDFRETHDSLASWLAQKEKMVTVLGPVATEPAMVNNQLQQVKVRNIQGMQSHQLHRRIEENL